MGTITNKAGLQVGVLDVAIPESMYRARQEVGERVKKILQMEADY